MQSGFAGGDSIESLKKIQLYDDIALYVPGLACSLVVALVFSVKLESFSGASSIFAVIVLGVPLGLTVQSLAALIFSPIFKSYSRHAQKSKSFEKLEEGEKDLLRRSLGPELSSEALFTRCVTRYSENLDSYVKFKALSDICRSMSFIFLLLVVLAGVMLFFPSYRSWIFSIASAPISMAEVSLAYVLIAAFCSTSVYALLKRSFHFTRISNDIVFDVAISRLNLELENNKGTEIDVDEER